MPRVKMAGSGADLFPLLGSYSCRTGRQWRSRRKVFAEDCAL